MNGILSIRPSREIRNNYAKISELTRENPVAITVNGREDTVLISHEDYMAQQRLINEMQARIMLYEHLAQSKEDINMGRTESIDKVGTDIKNALDELDI